ncbi:hypothetical protein D0868_06530 [Hortaea werneckii]|uniref:Delta(14)-sterol reductase n=1 Tax=Hortaea werneckii TaxID=91943 RepID=A0A3M6YQE6_HORWE|nr:hypothetical protein D0868_06530 [Hortaea werneckii]
MAPKKASSATTSAQTEKPHGYEFGGPIGALFISLGLPIACYAFAFLCNDVSGCPAPSLLSPTKLFTPPILSRQAGWQHALDVLKVEVGWPGFAGLLSLEATLGALAWYGLSLLLYVLLPANEVEGTELRSGGKLIYRMNSFSSALVTLGICAAGTWALGPDFQVWTFINRNYLQLMTANLIISFALATYVYVRPFEVKPGNKELRELAAGGHSGNMLYDWFIGRELNPRVTIPLLNTEVDIKAFMELRPGLLGWIILDLAFMAHQYKSYGYITDSILIVTVFQALYVMDALYNEPAILTTIDLTNDGFGLMLAFGDLVWVPFIYSLQARYLSVHPVILGPLYVTVVLGLQGLGYYIFRQSNSQKNAFRTNPNDPSVAHLKYIETASGSRLLTSGWWGTARHINYLGDWLMGWSYCLPTLAAGYKIVPSVLTPGTRLVTTEGMAGAAIPITYFYMLYFAILLIHREMRDEEKCSRKYGKDWERYSEVEELVNPKSLSFSISSWIFSQGKRKLHRRKANGKSFMKFMRIELSCIRQELHRFENTAKYSICQRVPAFVVHLFTTNPFTAKQDLHYFDFAVAASRQKWRETAVTFRVGIDFFFCEKHTDYVRIARLHSYRQRRMTLEVFGIQRYLSIIKQDPRFLDKTFQRLIGAEGSQIDCSNVMR